MRFPQEARGRSKGPLPGLEMHYQFQGKRKLLILMLTDEMTRLRNSILAMRNMRSAMMNELEQANKARKRAVSDLCRHFHIPKGPGAQHEALGILEIKPEFELGLKDIEGFSHLFVIWLFDRAEGFELVGIPPTDDREHGVFATRSPRRPNPIGLTVVRLLRREGALLHVKGVDMLDGTPILDIKPYLSSVPLEQLRRGWMTEAEDRKKPQA